MAETGETTKERLLRTAERLFAEYGIEAVTPRQIALAAGQLNQSAIRYHFGTKEALIEALLSRRIAEINQRRRAMLAAIEREGRLGDLRALMGAIAVPLAEKICATQEGSAYVRFLAHLFADRQRRDVLIARGREAALLRRIYKALRALTPDLPERVWNERLRLVVGGIIHALADRERMRLASEHDTKALSEAAFVGNLIDAGVAIFTAPISPETRRGLALQAETPAKEKADVAHR